MRNNMWSIGFCELTKVWYIYRGVLSGDPSEDEYLHSDGKVRLLAIDSQGEPTGYYSSEEAAQTAIKLWRDRVGSSE